jgi:GxxExxY protein
MNENEISKVVVDACFEIHKTLGPGLLESVYEECLCRELILRNLSFKRQEPVAVEYKGVKLNCGFRFDLLVEDLVVVEVKAVDKIMPVHKSQLLTYLKIMDKKLGLLVNFNEALIKHGINRVVNGYLDPIA